MDDPLILIGVLAVSALAIGLLVLLNRFLGGWTPARLSSIPEAGACLARDIIGFQPGDGTLAIDGRAALVRDAGSDRFGLVVAQGDRFVTRAIRFRDLVAVERDGAGLTLRLRDFTMPRVRITLVDDATAQVWMTGLQSLTEKEMAHDA